MKSLLFLSLVLLSFLPSSANVVDSVKQDVKETVAFVDTSSTFKMMYSDVKEALVGLSAALKVGAEHVYTILVKQQVVNSVSWIIFLISTLIIFYVSIKFVVKYPILIMDRDKDIHPGIIPFILFWICCVVAIIVVITNVNNIVMGLINPEYGAIMDILKFVK